MRVAIVENTRVTHHGQVGVALHEAAARIDLYKPWVDGRLPELGDHDGLVVLGGPQSALADDTHPYLPTLARLMADSARQGQAVLGICLGAQVMARGCGAENHLGRAPEFGWCDVEVTEAAQTDPVLSQVPAVFPIFQWHSDTFTLPKDAVHLARNGTAAAQSFRVGRAGYAMQFHFEASRAMVRDWQREFADEIEAFKPGWNARHATEAATRGVQADAAGLALARAWVGLI